MNIKTLLGILILVFIAQIATALVNKSELDSLHLKLNQASDDTVRMLALDHLASYYAESNRDSAMHYNRVSIEIAEKLDLKLRLADFLLLKAYLVQKQSNLALSYKLCMEALKIAQDESNELDASISDPSTYRIGLLIGVYHQLGNTASSGDNRSQAITYYKKEIEIADEMDVQGGRMTSNMNIGTNFLKMDQLDSALIYSKRAIKASDATGWTEYKGNVLRDIGKVYFKKGFMDSAKYYYQRALYANKEHNNLASDITINISLADFYDHQGQADSMYFYASTALGIAQQLNTGIAGSAERVAKAWAQIGKMDSAYSYLSISKQLGDSLSADKNKKLLEYQSVNFDEKLLLEKEVQRTIESRNSIRTTALLIGLLVLAILVIVFYRNNRQKRKANVYLERAYAHLKSTQTQLIHSEKMASLGELTAGIAHEIQNPLNFVNNFSELSEELTIELEEELDKGDIAEAKVISGDLVANLKKINHHGKRASDIVKSMLQHSRTGSGEKELTDINALADEYLRLSYHGLRAKNAGFNADFKLEIDESLPKVNVIPQDMGRVLLNLINNAFHAVKDIENPQVIVATKVTASNQVQITVSDNGSGIPDSIKEKIFQPFFTTKATGEGTGLGLSMSYDIVTKGHGGSIAVESNNDKGTTFSVSLPYF